MALVNLGVPVDVDDLRRTAPSWQTLSAFRRGR
jgi:hypothetical protein